MTISQQYASFIKGLQFDEIPSSAVNDCKIVILDTIGVALGGSQAKHSRIAAGFASDYGEKKESTVFAYGYKTSCLNAALANGVMAHSIDFDDDYEPGAVHIACCVIPAAIAIGEARGVTGKDLITAVVAGYDIVSRAAAALALKDQQSGSHITGSIGCFGSAAASGKLLSLEEYQLVHALGLAGEQACGLMQYHFDGCMQKHLHAGKAAQNGLFSALLAGNGFTGPPEVFEGEYGFYNVLFRGEYDPTVMTKDLGNTFRISETSLKPYPSCRGTHSPIAAALNLQNHYNIDVNEIDKIKIRLFSRAFKSFNKPSPETGLQSLLSIQYCVATALLRGRITLNDFSSEAITDGDVRELMTKIYLTEDDNLTDVFNKKRNRPIVMEISLKNGTKLEDYVEDAPGCPANPMSEADRLMKFQDLTSPVLGREKMKRLMNRLLNLERVENLTAAAELLH